MAPLDLSSLFRETLAALCGERLVRDALGRRGWARPQSGGRRVLLGLGKPAPAMARAALASLGPAPVDGVVVATSAAMSGALPGLRLLRGAHPVPDAASEAAGRALLAAADAVGPADSVILLIGGGGSALAAVPAPGLTLADKVAATRALLRSGASIEEMNVVRKHLSAIKGGQLGLRIRASRSRALLVCDVPSGDLASVASGPALPDPSTFAQALAITDSYRVALTPAARERLERGVRGEVPESPKPGGASALAIEHERLAAPADLALTAAALASRRGHRAEAVLPVLAAPVESVATTIVERARAAPRPTLLAFAGEPSVSAPADAGEGGRMQHLALLLARELAGTPFRALCAGSDGRDGATDACGALVDGATAARAGPALERAVRRFDSGRACRELGLALPAFASDTNLCDLVLVALEP